MASGCGLSFWLECLSVAGPPERAADGEAEDDNYMPPSEDEASLDYDEFVVPEDPVEQERWRALVIRRSILSVLLCTPIRIAGLGGGSTKTYISSV